MAVRDASIYNGKSVQHKRCASSQSDIEIFAQDHAFSHIKGFDSMVKKSLKVLDNDAPEWFDNATRKFKDRNNA